MQLTMTTKLSFLLYRDMFEDKDEAIEPYDEPEATMPEAEEYTEEAYDVYLSAENIPDKIGDAATHENHARMAAACLRKDGSSDWILLADIKESYPVQDAAYTVGNKIDKEPAFAWWVSHGRLPHSVAEALHLGRENVNDFWTKAIEKEMKNVCITFEFHPNGEIPVGHKPIGMHWVFDIKLGTLE
eukprot:scaffold31629_cov68-Attheya_sp.AAC.2